MGQNCIFHPCEAHILSCIDVTVFYKKNWAFENYQVSTKNPKGLAFRFTEKRLFEMKTGWKLIFLDRDGHLMPRLDGKVLYINF
jgi:hypothetical protein